MYLLPAGSVPRTKNKWGLGGLGLLPARAMSNGGGMPRSNMILFRPPILPPNLPTPIFPGPLPVWPGSGGGGGSVGIRPTQQCNPGDVAMANATWDPVGCRWIPNPILPPNPPTPKLPPSTPASPTAGTPVPPGYPVNQFFVAPDGSVWEYSTSSNAWFNTGTPYNAGGSSSGGATSSTPTAVTSSGATQPVSVTVNAPAATAPGYQAILDWLTQQTLISGIPNWIIGGGAALLAWKLMGSSGGHR